MPTLVATDREVVVIDVERGPSAPARGIGDRPTCLAADPLVDGRAWCGTHRGGVFRTDDGGGSWQVVGPACRVDSTTPTSSPFTTRRPIPCASPLAMDISRVTMPAPRGACPAPASRSA